MHAVAVTAITVSTCRDRLKCWQCVDESSKAAGDDTDSNKQPKMELRPSVIGNNY